MSTVYLVIIMTKDRVIPAVITCKKEFYGLLCLQIHRSVKLTGGFRGCGAGGDYTPWCPHV